MRRCDVVALLPVPLRAAIGMLGVGRMGRVAVVGAAVCVRRADAAARVGVPRRRQSERRREGREVGKRWKSGFGDDRRAAVEQAVVALATLSSDTLQQCRAFFAEADASLRAVGTSAASRTEALPGVAQAVGSLFASYFPSILIMLRSVASSDICVNAYRRRLYWLSRCWALAIEGNGASLQALADVCVEDISDGDAAVATAALDVARPRHPPPTGNLPPSCNGGGAPPRTRR